ncbi:MAG: hypothetical protein Q9221_005767 [Calogaya cf. arnoldii]
MSRFFRTRSSASGGSRPSQPPSSPSWPGTSSRKGSLSTSGRAPRPLSSADLINGPSLTLASIRAQWTLGLTQHNDFQLHAALRTFKRLLRALRIPAEENSRPMKEDNLPTSSPYQILQPQEVALLFINIGLIHAFLGSYYLAGQAFEEALVLDQTSAVAWFGLGIAKFYSIEFSASKRAFERCQGCFTSQNADGKPYDELIYNVWPGQLRPSNRQVAAAADKHDSDRLNPFIGIMSSRLPNGQWKLLRVRAEWNLRRAEGKRTWIKDGVEEVGLSKLGLHGIPAGVIFGLDLGAGHTSSTEDHQADNDTGVKYDARASDDTDRSAADHHENSTRDNRAKPRWIGSLQEKFLRGKSFTRATKENRTLGWIASSQSHSSLASSIQQTPAVTTNDSASPTPTQAAFPSSPGVDDRSPSPLFPSNSDAIRGLYNEDAHDDEELHQSNDHPESFPNETSSMFPTRQSSLTDVPPKPSRHSRGVSLSINTVIPEIEEELLEAGNGRIWVKFIPYGCYFFPWIGHEGRLLFKDGRNGRGAVPRAEQSYQSELECSWGGFWSGRGGEAAEWGDERELEYRRRGRGRRGGGVKAEEEEGAYHEEGQEEAFIPEDKDEAKFTVTPALPAAAEPNDLDRQTELDNLDRIWGLPSGEALLTIQIQRKRHVGPRRTWEEEVEGFERHQRWRRGDSRRAWREEQEQEDKDDQADDEAEGDDEATVRIAPGTPLIRTNSYFDNHVDLADYRKLNNDDLTDLRKLDGALRSLTKSLARLKAGFDEERNRLDALDSGEGNWGEEYPEVEYSDDDGEDEDYGEDMDDYEGHEDHEDHDNDDVHHQDDEDDYENDAANYSNNDNNQGEILKPLAYEGGFWGQ